MIAPDLAKLNLNYLEELRYATLEHAFREVICGLRLGVTSGTDVDDFDKEAQSLTLVHRPAKGTTLKNEK